MKEQKNVETLQVKKALITSYDSLVNAKLTTCLQMATSRHATGTLDTDSLQGKLGDCLITLESPSVWLLV
jgi:hypothetical protein